MVRNSIGFEYFGCPQQLGNYSSDGDRYDDDFNVIRIYSRQLQSSLQLCLTAYVQYFVDGQGLLRVKAFRSESGFINMRHLGAHVYRVHMCSQIANGSEHVRVQQLFADGWKLGRVRQSTVNRIGSRCQGMRRRIGTRSGLAVHCWQNREQMSRSSQMDRDQYGISNSLWSRSSCKTKSRRLLWNNEPMLLWNNELNTPCGTMIQRLLQNNGSHNPEENKPKILRN